MNDTVNATAYLQVAPEWSGYYSADDPRGVRGAKVVGVTQKRSSRPKPGTVEVKVTIRLPKSAFLPLRPEAVVVIPESLTVPHPVEEAPRKLRRVRCPDCGQLSFVRTPPEAAGLPVIVRCGNEECGKTIREGDTTTVVAGDVRVPVEKLAVIAGIERRRDA